MVKEQQTQRKQKDLAEKQLLDCNDVFADIVNAVVFQGKQIIKLKDLREAHPVSSYREDGLRSQERDIAKRWVKGNTTICFIGTENQNEIDPDMLFRNIGYDGAAYRDQMNQGKERYPVVTFVLYCGDKQWNKPLTLHETLGNIPEDLKRYVNDYRMNLIDVKRMDQSEMERLKSDFWHVVKTIQESKQSDYEPDDTRIIVHAKEVGAFMTEYSGINYSGAVKSLSKRHERITMKSLLSEAEKKEILEKNTEEVTADVTVKTTAADVLNLMKKKNMEIEDIFETLEVPEDLRGAVLEEVKRLS